MQMLKDQLLQSTISSTVAASTVGSSAMGSSASSTRSSDFSPSVEFVLDKVQLNYEKEDVLGVGSFGKVYKGSCHSDKKMIEKRNLL